MQKTVNNLNFWWGKWQEKYELKDKTVLWIASLNMWQFWSKVSGGGWRKWVCFTIVRSLPPWWDQLHTTISQIKFRKKSKKSRIRKIIICCSSVPLCLSRSCWKKKKRNNMEEMLHFVLFLRCAPVEEKFFSVPVFLAEQTHWTFYKLLNV